MLKWLLSWIKPPLTEEAHCRKMIEDADRYLVFIRDMIKAEGIRDAKFKKWSREEFEDSGYVRCDFTEKRKCYCIPRTNKILFTFKNY